MKPVGPLLDLARALGLSRSDLAAVERRDAAQGTFRVASEALTNLTQELVDHFVDVYGPAGALDFRLEDVILFNAYDKSTNLEQLKEITSGFVDVVIGLDKRRILEELADVPTDALIVLYLFPESLHHAFAEGIHRFEQHVWPDADKRLIILIAQGSPTALRGEWLTVAGGPTLDEWRNLVPQNLPDRHRVASMRQERDRLIGWDQPWVSDLTPRHFLVEGSADQDLVRLLRFQFVKLALLFTCDRARNRPRPSALPEIRAEYRGKQHVAVVPIDESEPVEIGDESQRCLVALVEWCYPPRDPPQAGSAADRLPFVQTRLAEALEPRGEHERLPALIKESSYLLEGLEWHWKAFIEGKVSSYLDQVRELETLVTDTSLRFADQVGELVKSLTDAMLAAVAALIGSFLAAAFKDPFNEALFRIGMWTYAVYVLAFPGLLGLISSWRRMTRARDEFDSRRRSFEQTLYPTKVEEIVGSRIQNATLSYWRWFAAIAAIYVTAAVCAFGAANYIPRVVSPGEQYEAPTSSGATTYEATGPSSATKRHLRGGLILTQTPPPHVRRMKLRAR